MGLGLCRAARLFPLLSLAIPSLAAAHQPRADCDGAVAAVDLRRASFVESSWVVERIEDGVPVEVERATRERSLLGGTSLLEYGFTAPLAQGSYVVRLETKIYDGLEGANPPQSVRAAWPRARVLRAAEVGDTFTCGGLAPVFDTTPPLSAHVGTQLASDVHARDGIAPRYGLLAGPAAAEIDGATGALRWTPTSRDVGLTTIILVVEDTVLGRRRVQGFELYVSAP